MQRTRNPSLVPAILAATLSFVTVSRAADFRVPTGFNGHLWGEPFTELPGMKLWHANTAHGAQGMATDYELLCGQNVNTGSECDPSMSGSNQTIESAGTFALAEYYLNVDANPWASSGVRPYSISYLYLSLIHI